MAADTSHEHTTRILPPWLWFWLAVYILSLPNQMAVWGPIWQSLSALLPHPNDILPVRFLLNLVTILEVVPLLVVFVGVLTIFLPKERAARVERHFHLSEPPTAMPVVREICAFLDEHVPGIVVRANLLRTDQFARIYPLSYRKTAIALFGGIVKLWRNDQQAARAVLLHEVAHYRQGDALIVGVGSLFTRLLGSWFYLYLGFLVLPLILAWGYQTFAELREFSKLGNLGVPFVSSELLLHELKGFFLIFLPGTLLISIGLLFWTVNVIILPLMGIWSAEFNADRFVIGTRHSPDDLLRTLEKLPRATSWGRWLLFGMSHPPARLRYWMASLPNRQSGLSVPILLFFPLAYIGKLMALVIYAAASYLMIKSGSEITMVLWENAKIYLATIAPIWLAMTILLLLWPMIAGFWEWLFWRHRGVSSVTGVPAYITSAVLIGMLALSGYAVGR
jgi:Zn-dependent protease with chaperone function